ncbi:hypothetical protein BHE90_004158 [Fusarium euwallaceae]|uniref:Uncharacterized protein n=1 Tax=Fusarium euwallaceae TaxID=1147111 RepID=A0A430M049_9HYPO|nr:hypothetical protein BHE90_004158 [Fusarium euwallaceae]
MATTVISLLNQHPTNPVHNTLNQSETKKLWAKSYHPLSKLKVHTVVRGPSSVIANFDEAFLGDYEDETVRLQNPALPSNYRKWRMDSEADGIQWFHTEISNIVLAAFAECPSVIQASHEKPLSETKTDQIVDVSYSIRHGRDRLPIAIGEFKRGLLRAEDWQAGNVKLILQSKLSRELRGYAYLYECPHIFCFDNYTFIMLQFRAKTRDDIKDAKCVVDCWVFPRDNFHGTPLRYALYRLLVQGFRRCQGLRALDVSLFGVRPSRREFYNGRPLWNLPDGLTHSRPWGHTRRVDPAYGAFYWADGDGPAPLLDQNGTQVWDTAAFWEPAEEHAQQDDDSMAREDLYGPA